MKSLDFGSYLNTYDPWACADLVAGFVADKIDLKQGGYNPP